MKPNSVEKRPRVSVLMSVCNSEAYLREAVDSILKQTFGDFEFIIVDDGSTDASYTILESYGDSRIVLLHNPENRGLAYSLNSGLALAKGDYVARMDADDISSPRRFERQVAYLEAHPEVGILGGGCVKIDEKGGCIGQRQMPQSDLQIRWVSLLGNPFIHPTVMIRRSFLITMGLKYDETFETTQDYDLWTRVLNYTCGANLGEPIIQYRCCDNVTSIKRRSQLINHDIVASRTVRQQLPTFGVGSKSISELRMLFVGGSDSTFNAHGKRVALGNLYLDMFERFTDRYKSEPNLRALKREVARKVVRIILHRPLEKGWFTSLKRLTTLAPTFIIFFLLSLKTSEHSTS
jgi:glycosyltransferase involved in cell wall biosynthesis